MLISLAPLTLRDCPPEQLVDVAAETGCDCVCLFPRMPFSTPVPLPTVDNAAAAKVLKRRIDDRGLSVCNVEAFICSATISPESFTELAEMGVILGARRVAALNFHPDFQGAVDRLSAFCELAAGYQLDVGFEWTLRSETKTLGDALRLIKAVNKQNLSLVVDVMHLMRSGGHPRELTTVEPHLLQYLQISDGPLNRAKEEIAEESISNRQFPGEGEFPLIELVQAFPSDAVIGIEAPTLNLAKTLTPLERARRAVEGTRRVIAAAKLGAR